MPHRPSEQPARGLLLTVGPKDLHGERWQSQGPPAPVGLRVQEFQTTVDSLERRDHPDEAGIEVDR
jgi:hypothetical protein